MNIFRAVWWIQTQPGVKITVGKKRLITITDGVNVEAKAIGLIRCINKVQRILKQLQDAPKSSGKCDL